MPCFKHWTLHNLSTLANPLYTLQPAFIVILNLTHLRPFFSGGGLLDLETESLYLLRFALMGLLEFRPRSGEPRLSDLLGGGLGEREYDASRPSFLALGGAAEALSPSRALRATGERLSLGPRRSTGERDRESYDDPRLGDRLGERLS
ncbi:hypothetical protein CPAR01_13998 [Colletotrichum paranaense]|uniref:Uncharacterized protein n=2 Tax=Colletotrichum acutatum species complex TaxID=2707335 RepID=A0AAI9US11_9PEZI|nr:uncharacterized protein CPAR01_13998 [Colletotrichum paranaense]KAK1462539.1 hypothetical protein CMEL01_13650 [Colletotrichum melonis]KAK1523145.1 hypothetical protein CPAR01_13998 [Colletotrichum paranaense]